MSKDRTGEKWGWIGGWLGSFLWMPILGVVVGWQRGFGALLYLVFSLSLAAFLAIFLLAPWRHPKVRYLKLMLPLYLILIAGVVALVRSYENMSVMELLPAIPGLLMVLMPLWFLGRKRWCDGDEPGAAGEQS